MHAHSVEGQQLPQHAQAADMEIFMRYNKLDFLRPVQFHRRLENHARTDESNGNW